MGLITFTLVSLVFDLLLVEVSSTNRHMICKEVESIFSQNPSGVEQGIRSMGPPGKKGPPGPKGVKGEQGEPGRLNYSAVEDIIEAKVNEKIQEKFEEIEALFAYYNSTLLEKEKKKDSRSHSYDNDFCKSRHGITYLDRCYWLIKTSAHNVTYETASQLCQEQSGSPGDVLDANHYNDLLQMARNQSVGAKTYFWTGMTVNIDTKELKLSNSSAADQKLWYPGYPQGSGTNTMLWFNGQSIAVWNSEPAGPAQGALCQN